MTQQKKENKHTMVWIDMEMTGLNPERDRIIEIATLVTDSRLNIVAEGPSLVIHQPGTIMKKMDAWNRKHHGASGLTASVKASKISVKKAEKMTLDFIKQYCVPKKAVLCGNSVYQDRRFIIKYMPRLDKFLHYRLIDVSTIKDLVRRWYPKNKEMPKKNENHRALDDIRESVEELRFYRKHYFRT
jgi:oligoribonuclease